jgi:hypothetical protein
MLGDNVKMSRTEFDPYLPDKKDGYFELDQIKPGVAICPFCTKILDATQDKQVLSTYEVIKMWPDSHASVPICRCPGVWAVYSPKTCKWSFRYRIDNGDLSWQTS